MRRTGQTFRALLGALKLASEGRHVIYECLNDNIAKWTFDKATRITADFMVPDSPAQMVLKIGDGSVRFVKKLNEKEVCELEASEEYELVCDR